VVFEQARRREGPPRRDHGTGQICVIQVCVTKVRVTGSIAAA
jgi:hypothetical protein